MSKSLDHLLTEIDPQRTLDETEARAADAMNSFNYPRGTIQKWDEFTDCIGRFLRHIEDRVLHLRGPVEVSSDYYWKRAIPLLHASYGAQGEKAAFEMARTGCEGGLYRVLKDLAGQVAEQYAAREIAARILEFWNPLSVDDKLAVSNEFIRRCGHLLPSELKEARGTRIHASFHRILAEYPRLLQRLRRICGAAERGR